MNINVASQNQGVLAWAGASASPLNGAVDIRHHNHFAFTFHVMADIAVEAVFKIQAAPPSDADPCLPGAFHDVPEVLSCMSTWGAVGDDESKIAIPVGTKAGSICTATLPCRPDAFVKVVVVSGDTGKVEAVVVLGGPR
ncbi:hypothetical protein [Bradyrhizobium elkanii]|uniref:hypothetical protein n=1 Tax=Bradyrhizobium elkanii TaxID=29448 RepID=UPI0004B8ED63|nr:hypothetical protein [Bradyrhizobium elkanii]WLA79585.1 hypothetical protein QNJ99_29835 [Bradyrhizobium elkanii]